MGIATDQQRIGLIQVDDCGADEVAGRWSMQPERACPLRPALRHLRRGSASLLTLEDFADLPEAPPTCQTDSGKHESRGRSRGTTESP